MCTANYTQYQAIVHATHLRIRIRCRRTPILLLLQLVMLSYIHWPQLHSNLKRMQSKEVHQILDRGKLQYIGDATDPLHSADGKLAHTVFLPKHGR